MTDGNHVLYYPGHTTNWNSFVWLPSVCTNC